MRFAVFQIVWRTFHSLSLLYGHRCLKIRMLSQNTFQLILEVVDHEVYTALKRGWQKCMHFWVQVLFNKLLCNFQSTPMQIQVPVICPIFPNIRMVLRKQFYPIVNSDWRNILNAILVRKNWKKYNFSTAIILFRYVFKEVFFYRYVHK